MVDAGRWLDDMVTNVLGSLEKSGLWLMCTSVCVQPWWLEFVHGY